MDPASSRQAPAALSMVWELLMVRAVQAVSPVSVRDGDIFQQGDVRALPPGFQGRQQVHGPFLPFLYQSGHFF